MSRVPRFVLLVIALSVPLWVIGGVTGRQFFEGLPVSALMALCPGVAAVLLTRRDEGGAAARALVRRSLDYRKVRTRWYVPILCLKPAIMALSYGLMRRAGMPLPPARLPVLAAAATFLAFFVFAVGEELGWSGYATERLRKRWSALRTGIVLGVVWALWHVVPLLQAHRAPDWLAWHAVETVATRVIIVWLFEGTGGSVFAAALYHAVDNLSWVLFPDLGSGYDPRVTAPLVVLAAALVGLTGTLRKPAAGHPSP